MTLSDADGGPNNLQNFPMITEVKSKTKGLEVKGTLLSNSQYQLPSRIFQ